MIPRSPPSFMIMSRACGGVRRRSPTCEAMLPISSPPSAIPTSQPSEPPRCSRQASASGLRSAGCRGRPARPLRAAGRAPRSRRATSAYAAADTSAAKHDR